MKTSPAFLILLIFISACDRQTSRNEPLSTAPGKGVMCGGGEPTDTTWYSSGQKAPLFDGLDGIDFTITTKKPEAQKYFNQGLMLSYAFNHAEAARSFYEATRLDSTCAMCWWGYAYVLGPNYNAGMEPDNYKRAYAASQKAFEHMGRATPLEKDLVMALMARYSHDESVERRALDSAYVAQMRKVYAKYPAHAEVAALFAESIMDLHPWDLWHTDGQPKPWTEELLNVIENGIAAHGNHPGLKHWHIHACEASNQPERAMASADQLGTMVPGAGHLVHMPSHIYIRTGKYHEGTLANLRAAEVDSQYVEACHAQGAYPLAYYPHVYHFLAATGTLTGHRGHALMGAYKMREHVNQKLMTDPAWGTLMHYYTAPWNVEVKFGMWDKILHEPTPPADMKYPRALLHYARGMAYVAKGNNMAAEQERQKLEALMSDSSIQLLTIWGVNKMSDLLLIANHILTAEIASSRGKHDKAITALKEAIRIEEALHYAEPPDWFFSVRHHLGAIQLKAGLHEEAMKTYEEDLETFRENGWALMGLYNAYTLAGDAAKAAEMKKRFDAAWQYADTQITSSRLM